VFGFHGEIFNIFSGARHSKMALTEYGG
jgi:hypothetical protein